MRSYDSIAVLLAYLQIRAVPYPYRVKLKGGIVVEVQDWQDLTTAWVVFFGNEYVIKKTDRSVLDLGANIGCFSLLAASSAIDCQVVACEPFPSTYERMKENFSNNSVSERIRPLQVAGVGKDGDVRMPEDSSIASHSRRLGQEGVLVKGLSLKSLLAVTGWEEIDFLKVDIEGGEYDLFEQADQKTLSKCKRIGLEYHANGDWHHLREWIEAAGFTLTRYPKRGDSGVVEFTRKAL